MFSILLASAMTLPTTTNFTETMNAANAINAQTPTPTVLVNPPAHLYADAAEDDAFETPLGRVEKIADDISIIKNAVETGKVIKDATTEVAITDTPKSWTQWVYLGIGALLAFFLKLAFGICVRFKEVCSKMNQILKAAEETEKKE